MECEKYGCEIVEQWIKLCSTQMLLSDSYIVEYKIHDEKIIMILTEVRQVKIFDMYYDKFKSQLKVNKIWER